MRRGFTIIEVMVVLAISAILAGMIIPAAGLVMKSAEKANNKVDEKDQWKSTANLTPSANMHTYILTDVKTGQQWVVVRVGNGVTMTTYNPNTKVE